MVEVRAGESFVVPPDYGHLQINPSAEPLVFSYAVRDGMKGQYEPFKARRGAAYYMMANGGGRYRFNPRYGDAIAVARVAGGGPPPSPRACTGKSLTRRSATGCPNWLF